MLIREGDEWLSLKEVAELAGCCQETVHNHIKSGRLKSRPFHAPIQGKPTSYIRRAEAEEWAVARKSRFAAVPVPGHLENVMLPLQHAAKLGQVSRQTLWRMVVAGDLPHAKLAGFEPLVRLGDLSRLRRLDEVMLAELEACVRGFLKKAA